MCKLSACCVHVVGWVCRVVCTVCCLGCLLPRGGCVCCELVYLGGVKVVWALCCVCCVVCAVSGVSLCFYVVCVVSCVWLCVFCCVFCCVLCV